MASACAIHSCLLSALVVELLSLSSLPQAATPRHAAAASAITAVRFKYTDAPFVSFPAIAGGNVAAIGPRDTAQVMSQENVEKARRFSETMAAGDYATAAAMLAPDFTVDDTDIPESTGADSFYEWIGRWDAAFE